MFVKLYRVMRARAIPMCENGVRPVTVGPHYRPPVIPVCSRPPASASVDDAHCRLPSYPSRAIFAATVSMW